MGGGQNSKNHPLPFLRGGVGWGNLTALSLISDKKLAI